MSGGQVYGPTFAVIPEAVLFADVSTNAKVLYAIFALHADSEGRCYPGLKRLAAVMRCSEDTVKRAKKELLEAKLIECHERYDEHGRRTTDDVILRGAPRNAAPYVGGKDAPTELEPERSNPTPYGVGSGVTSARGGKNGPPPEKTGAARYACRVCGVPATLSLGGADNWLCDAHQPRTAEPDITMNADAVNAIKTELGWAK